MKIVTAGTRVISLLSGRMGVVTGEDTDPAYVWVRYDRNLSEQMHRKTSLRPIGEAQ